MIEPRIAITCPASKKRFLKFHRWMNVGLSGAGFTVLECKYCKERTI